MGGDAVEEGAVVVDGGQLAENELAAPLMQNPRLTRRRPPADVGKLPEYTGLLSNSVNTGR